MINWQPTNLANQNVGLRPLKPEDFETLFNVASDPKIWEQHPAKDRYLPEVFKAFFEDAIQGSKAFLLVENTTNAVMGSSRYYDYNLENNSIAIGYTFLGTQFWGGKYNFQIKKLMIDYAFQFVDNVIFHIGSTNYRSQKAIEKNGGIKTKEIIVPNQTTANFEYQIKKENWAF